MAPCPGGSGSSPRSPPSPVSAEPLSSQVPPACPGAGQDFGELLLVELQLCVSPPLLPVQVPRDGSTLWGQSTKSILPQGSTRSLSKTHPHFPHPKTSPRWDLWGLSCTPIWVPALPEEGSGSKAPAGEAGGAAAAQAGQIFPRLEKQLLITDKTPSGDFAPFSSPPPAGAFAEGKTISPQTGMAQPGPRMYTRDQTLDQSPGR